MPSRRRNFKLTFCCGLLFLATGLFAGCQSAETNGTSNGTGSAPTPSPTASPSPSNAETASDVTESLADAPIIVAFGDSLTAGYGLSESRSYPARLQRLLLERGYRYRVVNAGVSGDTSAGGVRRLDWALKGDVKVLILELGANDGLRGQSTAEMKKNLDTIIEKAKARGVKVIIAGMEAPPNLGPEYTREFRQVFSDLARKHDAPLIPFFLDRVGGISDLNQADGIHPNDKGTEIVVENVWRVLEPLLK